ncbi:hypothetical protein D9M68_983610 [compost metagenome]
MQNLAMNDAVPIAHRLGLEGKPVPDDRLEIVLHQPSVQVVMPGDSLPNFRLAVGNDLFDNNGASVRGLGTSVHLVHLVHGSISFKSFFKSVKRWRQNTP